MVNPRALMLASLLDDVCCFSEASIAATVKSDAFSSGAKQEIRAFARDECCFRKPAMRWPSRIHRYISFLPSTISNLRLSGEKVARHGASDLEISQREQRGSLLPDFPHTIRQC